MQHPDEGTIHSWLDNALSAEETARVEAHVAECSHCAAAVAEARGFIAASSRILTALDDVPAGVVPGTTGVPARKRHFRVFWRAAAAVLVVTGGSVIVLRDSGQEMRTSGAVSDSTPVESKGPELEAAGGTTSAASAPASVEVAASQPDPESSPVRRTASPPVPAGKVTLSSERDFSATPTFGRVSAPVGTTTGRAAGADTAASASDAMQLSANVVSEQSELRPLRVLKIERSIGSRRTVYEISPTDTVILTELEPVFLSGVVTTGIASAQDRQSKERVTRSVAPMRAEPAAAPPRVAPPTDARQADTTTLSTEAAAMGKTSAAPAQAAVLSTPTVNTIRWSEAATGKTLTLSGKLSVEQLQEIKRRIEAERTAANRKP